MKKNYSVTLLTFLLLSSVISYAQPWIYDFGTGTGTHTSSTASTTFLPTPSSGTARVRVGTNPGSIVKANAGLSGLGTNTELQITSNTGSSSTTKFSVYDYTAAKTGYVKFNIVFNGGTNGVYRFWLGDGTTFSDNNAMSNSQIFSGIQWTLGASNTITYNVLNNTTWGTTGITNPTTLFSQSTSNIYAVEVYANNTTASENYTRNGTSYSLTNATWDLWVDGTRVGTGLAKGALGTNVNFDSYAFNHQTSVTAPGTIYLDDIEYANALPKIYISDNGTQVVAADVDEGTNDHVLHKIKIDAVSGFSPNLTGMTCTTAGSYDAADISNLKVRYSTDATLDGADVTLSTLSSPGAAGSKTFPSFTSQTITGGTTGYIFITADIAASSSSGGNTISLNALTTANLTFSSGLKSGTTTDGGTQTIVATGAPSVTIDNTGAPAAGNIVYNTNNVIIGGFRLTPSASVDFTAVNVATSGTATTSDISNFELIYDADNSGTYNGGDAVVASVSALANPLAFSGFTETFSSARRYLIIADVAATATDGRTITTSIAAASDVSSTGNESGTATGNTQTIQAPEIRVEGNATEILDGDVTPTTTDHTGFGNVEVGQTLIRTFTIKNIGNQNLSLSGGPIVAISGSSQFVVTTQPSSSSVSGPSGSVTFQVTYTPTTYNTQTATISITNNDGNENPYNFDINGTGTSSSLSDITNDVTYGLTSNFDYKTWQTASPQSNTSDGLGMFNIIIRDGGTSSPDADGLPTILNAITFNCPTFANIRSAALFTTSGTHVASVAVSSANITFSGLSGANVTAPDNGNIELILRLSFNNTPATITDNTKIVFTITSATAASSATSSQFASTNAGGAVSDNDGDNENRLEVTASKLTFLQQPSTTTINATMSPSPTVRALDVNNILDLDYTTNISITSTGTMTGDPISVAAVAGVATFSSVVHTVAGTGYTLTAASGGFSNVTSNTFDINTIVYVNGDYRTIGSGNWVSNNATPAIWERYNGSTWAASNSPTYSTTNSVYIQNGHTITTGGSFGSSVNLKIMDGGTFNCNHSSTTASTYIYANGTLNINASFTMASGGDFEVEDNGNVNVNFAYGTPTSSIWQGVEIFHPNSNFTFIDWDAANDILIPDNTSISTNTYNGYTACFGNIILDFGDPSNLSASDDMIFLASGVTINMAHGDLIFRTNNVVGADMRISTTGTVTSGIGGDFIVEDSYYVTSSSNFINFKTSGTLTFTIKGDMVLDAATTRIGAGTNPNTTINIDGNLEVLGGAFLDLQSTIAATSTQTINLKGDLYLPVGGRISATNSNFANNIFNFTGPGDGLTDSTTQTIDNASTSSSAQDNIAWFVKPGAYVKLINRDFQIGNNGTFTVQGTLGNEGVLDFGYNGTSGWLIKERTSSAPSGTTVFDLDPNGKLKITHQNGIVTAPTADGNVQLDTRTFDLVATYHYIGKQNQFTGNALPSSSSSKVIICDMETNAMTLTMSGTTAVSSTTTTDATYGGHLYVKKGQLIETTTAYFTSGSGTLRMEPGTLYYIPRGSSSAAGANSDLIPRMSGGTYYLTGGTIEFAGTGTAAHAFQTLRGSRTYNRLKFSGANTYNTDYKNLSSNAIVDSSLEITNGAIVDCIDNSLAAATFTGDGGLIMSGTNSRLRLKKLTDPQPELIGDNVAYSLTGGTVEFYGTSATQQQQLRGNYTSAPSNKPKINYYNLDINAVAANLPTFTSTPNSTQLGSIGNVDVNSSFELTGTLNVNSPAVLRMDQNDFIDNGTGTSQVINVNSGAGLLYANENGIKTSGTGTNDGNIRTSGTRNFSTSANYGFVSSGSMVSGNGLPSTVAGLYMYKTFFNNTVTLNNGGTLVNGILGLQKGRLISSDAQKVTLAVVATSDIKSPANVGGVQDMGYDSSYVSGKLGHNSTSTSEMIFPIGSTTKYGPFALTPQNNTSQTYNGEYTSTGYGNYTLDPANSPQLDHVSLVEYWTINSSITPSANDDSKIKLFWRAHSVVGPSASEWSQLRVAHFDGTNWNTEGNSPAFHPTPSSDWGWLETDIYCANFSPFTIGTLTSLNPLPVELTSFTGTCNDGTVQINWSTASELNSSAFLVQRSEKGVDYFTVATVSASGNSNQPRNYSIIDSNSTNTNNYYRLIEVDIYGNQTIYSFIQVRCNEVNGVHIFYAEPRVIAEINSTKDKMIHFSVFEVSGKLIHQENRQVLRGYNRLDLGIKNKLTDGIYIIQMTDEDKISSSKIMVH